MVLNCGYSVPNGSTDVDNILGALNKHNLLGGSIEVNRTEGGGTAKSTTTLPMIEESITETQYTAWLHCFSRYSISCELLYKDIN